MANGNAIRTWRGGIHARRSSRMAEDERIDGAECRIAPGAARARAGSASTTVEPARRRVAPGAPLPLALPRRDPLARDRARIRAVVRAPLPDDPATPAPARRRRSIARSARVSVTSGSRGRAPLRSGRSQLRGPRTPPGGVERGHQPHGHPRPGGGRPAPRLRLADRGRDPRGRSAEPTRRPSSTSGAAAAIRACRSPPPCPGVASRSSSRWRRRRAS